MSHPAYDLDALPETEAETQLVCEQLADVMVGNVPREDARLWRDLGVRIGHA